MRQLGQGHDNLSGGPSGHLVVAGVAILRLEAGRRPDDPRMTDLVGELTVKSEDFSRWWSRQRVLERGGGFKRFHHPVVGDLTIDYEALTLPAEPEQTLFIYTARPGPSEDAMRLLASWSLDPARPPNTTQEIH